MNNFNIIIDYQFAMVLFNVYLHWLFLYTYYSLADTNVVYNYNYC